MAKTAAISVTFNLTGDGFGGSAVGMTNPTNNAAPPIGAAQCNGSSAVTTITVPSGYTVNGCVIFPPSGSANSKTLKGSSGDIGFTGWTNMPLIVPCTSGGTFVIVNTGSTETVSLLWC